MDNSLQEIQDLKNTVEELTKKFNDLSIKYDELKDSKVNIDDYKFHEHRGTDGTYKLEKSIVLKTGESLTMGIGGIGTAIRNEGSSTEIDITGLVSGRDLDSGDGTSSGNSQVQVYHPGLKTDYNSFFHGFRPPLYLGSSSVTNTGTTITITQSLQTNELAGAYLNVQGTTATNFQTLIIASNTANVITITGTFNFTESVSYVIWRPIFLGSADFPWRRIYIANEIRFGTGKTNPDDGTGGQTTGLLYMSGGALKYRGTNGTLTTIANA